MKTQAQISALRLYFYNTHNTSLKKGPEKHDEAVNSLMMDHLLEWILEDGPAEFLQAESFGDIAKMANDATGWAATDPQKAAKLIDHSRENFTQIQNLGLNAAEMSEAIAEAVAEGLKAAGVNASVVVLGGSKIEAGK